MDEYLKTLLEQIRCKKARPYIRQELQNHMEDQIEANIHAGMDYESAEEAVKDMEILSRREFHLTGFTSHRLHGSSFL